MPTLSEIESVINSVLKTAGKEPVQPIEPEMSLRDDIGMDSFDLVELTVRIEDKFGVDIFAKGVIDKPKEIIERLKGC
jgi:acyl carrier protein